ncbi:MAG TPA: ISL3 family transposase [Acinetobacter nosocomialis]|nr:ISL3 family transposase [Acinetobacter nosocomialis]
MTDILALPNWVVLSVEQGDELIISAEYQIQPDCCLKCGSESFYKHGPKPVSYRDSPVRGSPVVINAVLKRYRCRDCGGTFIQPITGMQPDMRMTERCYDYIKSQSLDDTFTRIANNIGCDDKTVRSIAHEYIADLNRYYEPTLVGWIGIDETTIDGKMRFVVCDLTNRRPLDMLPDREYATVSNYLWKHRNDPVEGFSMDMWKAYKKAINTVFPNTPIVIDKFHVVRMANIAMDEVRKRVAKKKPSATGLDWKRKKVLLRLRAHKLDEHGKFNLDMWLDNEPDLAIAYYLKELFYTIYDQKSKDDAIEILDEWLSIVPDEMCKTKLDFKALKTAATNWRTELLAYFDHRVTNGYTEALNGVAKVMNRQGRGYSYEMIRAKFLFRKMPSQEHFNYEKFSLITNVESNERLLEITLKPNKGLIRRQLILKFNHRCQSCSGFFNSNELFATWLNKDREYSLSNATILCKPCRERFDSTQS